jgi:hypothetical protein
MTESLSKPSGTEITNASSVAASASWVSIADVLAREVPVHWSEAVAVLAELCAVLLGQHSPVIPDTADVLISGAGKLSARTQDHGPTDPTALGRMLHSLFASGTTPAPLRLFASHAISSDRYPTVGAFAEALAAYEAPGRDKLIQAVHDRWVAARSEATPTPAAIPLRQEPEQERKPAEGSHRGRRLPRWAVAVAANAAAAVIPASRMKARFMAVLLSL